MSQTSLKKSDMIYVWSPILGVAFKVTSLDIIHFSKFDHSKLESYERTKTILDLLMSGI